MKDVEGTLRRIDEEIVGHHQQIAAHRVEVARLQETRLVLMHIAEDDIAAAEHAKMARQHVINGEHAKPVLIVRKEGAADEADEAEAKRAKKLAQQKKWREAAKKKRDMKAAGAVRDDDNKGQHLDSAVEAMRGRILTLLQGGDSLKRAEIGDKLGLPPGETNRKAMSNAVYSLLKRGRLKRDHAGRFGLAKS